MEKWYSLSGKNNDVVISGRVRLARNFSNFKFSPKITDEEANEMVNQVIGQFMDSFSEKYRTIRMKDCNDINKKALKQQRIISSHLAKSNEGAVLLSPNESVSVMLNAEDHVRIQVFCNGMNLQSCYNKANKIDDFLDSKFDYAFDEKYGYKTTYPTNLGTGMRVDYTLHLPALFASKKLSHIINEVGRFGIRIESVFGDEGNAYGSFYRISNQKTLGHSEKEIIKDLDDITNQIIRQEREQRKYLYEQDKFQTEDMAYKSYGVLKYARKLSLRDALTLISELWLGISLSIIKPDTDKFSINRIINEIQSAVIEDAAGSAITEEDKSVIRAEYLRNNIPELEVK